MKLGMILITVVAIGATAAALIFWKDANSLRTANSHLQLQLETLQQQTAQIEAEAGKREKDLSEVRKQAEDVNRLRGEVRQLRSAAREAEALRSKIPEPKADPASEVALSRSAMIGRSPAQRATLLNRTTGRIRAVRLPPSPF